MTTRTALSVTVDCKIELARPIVERIVGRAHRRLRDHNGLTLTCGAQAPQRLLVGRSLARQSRFMRNFTAVIGRD
jgi:hypothetical protein